MFCTAHEASLCCSWSKGLLDCLAQGCLLQAALTNGQGGPFQKLLVLRFHLSPQPLHWPRATKQHHLDSEAKSASLRDNCPEYVQRYRLNPGQAWEGWFSPNLSHLSSLFPKESSPSSCFTNSSQNFSEMRRPLLDNIWLWVVHESRRGEFWGGGFQNYG